MTTTDVLVVGAGITGIAASRRLAEMGIAHAVVESCDRPGGIARSNRCDGYTFDRGIHGIYTTDSAVRSAYVSNCLSPVRTVRVTVLDFVGTRKAPHPPQFSFPSLVPEQFDKIVREMRAATRRTAQAQNYRDWCIQSYGPTFASCLQLPYVQKFWCTPPTELTADWMAHRAPEVTDEDLEVLATGRVLDSRHYVREILYPEEGGFGAFVDGLSAGLPIHTGVTVTSIDPSMKIAHTTSGPIAYKAVVSTVPLSTLCNLLAGTPAAVIAAAASLRHTSAAYVNLGFRGDRRFPIHWAYALDQEVRFARLGSPSEWSSKNAPEGCSSLQAEIYFMGQLPSEDELLAATRDGLCRIGVIDRDEQPLHVSIIHEAMANVIHDHARSRALSVILPFVENAGIDTAGRYGRWDYGLADENTRQGWRAANRVAVRLAEQVA